eukprot:4689821-Amphidinium_carterae.1
MYKSQRGRFKVDDAISDLLHFETGTKQGCPLSGVWFAIALDGFIRMSVTLIPPPSSLSAFADDISCVIADVLGESIVELHRLTWALHAAANLKLNHHKVFVLPLHHDIVGLVLWRLSVCDPAWLNASVCTVARYLGYSVGPHYFDGNVEVCSKIRQRADDISAMHLGSPAQLGLARIVLWSCASHILSMSSPTAEVINAYQYATKQLIKGPQGWMNSLVASHLQELGWPAQVETPIASAMKLQTHALVRLRYDVQTRHAQLVHASLQCDALAVPLVQAWFHGSSHTALAETA